MKRRLRKMTLTYECVICKKKIRNPKMNIFTCKSMKCRNRYHAFQQDYTRKIYKLIKIKKRGDDDGLRK